MEIDKLAFADGVEVCPVTGERVAPKEFVVLKFGKNKYTLDGKEDDFDFDEQDADEVIDEFNRRGKDLLVDIEHASLIPGKPAPAYGWIRKLKKGYDGLVGEMANWTDEAKELLEKGKYRYHSPVLYFKKKDSGNRPYAIQSVTLTNHPALHRYDSLVAACDTSVNNSHSDIRKQIIETKIELDNESDATRIQSLSDKFSDEVQKFSDIAGKTAEYYEFANMLYLSDISNQAKKLFDNNDIPGLEELKNVAGITEAEIEYVNALINHIRENGGDSNIPFSDRNKQINNKKEAMKMLEEKLNQIKAFADGDMTADELAAAMGAQDENLGADAEGAEAQGEEDTNAILDQVKETVKTIISQLETLAQSLGINTAEMENEAALFDRIIGTVEKQKQALAKIADVYGSERKDDPTALADMVVVERIASPPQEEVRKLTEKLAMTDAKIQEQAAIKAVDEAIQAGTVPECNKEVALKLAMSDLKAFNDAFAPGNGIQIVPVAKSEQTVNAGQEVDKDDIEAQYVALSDSSKKIAKQFGLTKEEAVKNYGKK